MPIISGIQERKARTCISSCALPEHRAYSTGQYMESQADRSLQGWPYTSEFDRTEQQGSIRSRISTCVNSALTPWCRRCENSWRSELTVGKVWPFQYLTFDVARVWSSASGYRQVPQFISLRWCASVQHGHGLSALQYSDGRLPVLITIHESNRHGLSVTKVTKST